MARKSAGWVVDLSHIKTMRDFREFQQSMEGVGIMETFEIASSIVKKTPYENFDPTKAENYDDLAPWQWGEVQDQMKLALEGLFRKPK